MELERELDELELELERELDELELELERELDELDLELELEREVDEFEREFELDEINCALDELKTRFIELLELDKLEEREDEIELISVIELLLEELLTAVELTTALLELEVTVLDIDVCD